MSQTTEQDTKTVKKQLDKLQEALEIANENGLLRNDSDTYENIIEGIAEALRELAKNPPNTIEARKKFSLAHHQFNRTINSSSFWWRFKYSFGGHIVIYFIVILVSLFSMWLLLSVDFVIMWVPSWAYLWGCIGGILQGFWWLWQHVSERSLRKHWLIWYLLIPPMGAILGALTYLVFFGGFIAATGDAQIQSESFAMLLSALAGFSTRWAVEILDKLTTIIQIREK